MKYIPPKMSKLSEMAYIDVCRLTEDEARNTARKAYEQNTRLTSAEIGKAIGRSRRTVDRYIADLKATIHEDPGINVFRLSLLGMPQERIAQKLQESRETIRRYLVDLVTWPNQPNADLKKVLLLLK